MTIKTKRSVLVLAPHPGDESLGCGGTIRQFVEKGHPVDILFMTRGRQLHPHGRTALSPATRLDTQHRISEAVAASIVLGVRSIAFLNGNYLQLKKQCHLSAVILEILLNDDYDKVLCPWQHDAHDDSSATFSLLQIALQSCLLPLSIWLYEIENPLSPNAIIPIDDTSEHKRNALSQYDVRLSIHHQRETAMGLSKFRSRFSNAARFAEAFYVCSKEELMEEAQ